MAEVLFIGTFSIHGLIDIYELYYETVGLPVHTVNMCLKKKNRKKESKHMKNLLCQDTFQHRSYSSFLLSTEKIKQIMNKLKPLNTLFTILV